jgi:acyl-CoA thioester hydrolase
MAQMSACRGADRQGETASHGLRTPLEGCPVAAWSDDQSIAAPLQLIQPTVPPEWVDYNGHMSESCYLLAFGDQSDAFFRLIGIGEEHRAGGHSLYTVQSMISNVAEAHLGDELKLTLQILDADEKRLHIFHSMFNAVTGELLATGEQMLVYVDTAVGQSVPIPPDLLKRVLAIRAAHSGLAKPAQAGRAIAIVRKSR